MYDAILISPHYDYDRVGQPVPALNATDVQDLSMIIPLGIVHVAQYLHDCGLKVHVVHLPQELYTLQRLGLAVDQLESPIKAILEKYPARVCGLQAHFYLYSGGAVHVAGVYKSLFPESTILVGGYMATACWKEFLTTAPAIDGVVLGEGERTFHRVIEASERPGNGALRSIEGLACRAASGDFVYNPPRAEALLRLDAMPIIDPAAPPFNNLLWPPRSFMNISRGLCPEQCAYCVANNHAINPRPFRTMAIDRVLKQLTVYQKAGIRGIFLGENHFLNLSFMTELIEQIIQENYDLYFELETHPVVFADSRLLAKMLTAGFMRYTMGCESGSNHLLKRLGRRSNARQIMNSVEQIADAGGLVITSWICNLPGETETEFQETRAMLRRVVDAGGFIYWIENLHVLPGSPLHQNPEKWDIELLLQNLADWFRWSLRSKTYVDLEDVNRSPLDYLTHLNWNSDPHAMINRFFAQRQLARMLVPAMQQNLAERAAYLPLDLSQAERQRLDWYETRGWKLWLF
jgi:radical SAM superfamily enzyme YgiQ (UPF0313 family)